MSERAPMTPQGYDQLKADLKHLKSVERPKNVKEIEEARAHGDLSENAEFHAAKETQGHLARRISMIEDRLSRAQVIDLGDGVPDQVRFGCTVRLEDTQSSEIVSYQIVGEDEADASRGQISVSSPVARALLGKAVDDTVQVKIPKGVREFDILAILVEAAES